jgi:GTP-binding protein HflX
VLLTDTVGFIQKLPTQLVAPFWSMLEEVKEVDVSDPRYWRFQILLGKAGKGCLDADAANKSLVRVLNKIDLLDPEEAEYLKYEVTMASDHTVAISGLHGEDLQDFVAVVEVAMAELRVSFEIEIPYSMGDPLNTIHEQGNVEVVDYRVKGRYVRMSACPSDNQPPGALQCGTVGRRACPIRWI